MAAVIGFVLMFVSIYLLFSNEGRAVTTQMSLDEGLNRCLSLDDPFRNNKDQNGMLVHFTGPIAIDQPVVDPVFGVNVTAARYESRTEMYQWKESSRTNEIREGDAIRKETTYTYDRVWSTSVHNSNRFHEQGYENPTSPFSLGAHTLSAAVHVGSFALSSTLTNSINDWYSHVPPNQTLTTRSGVHLTRRGAMYYSSHDHDQIGDVRVSFRVAGSQNEQVSIIAQKSGTRLAAFRTDAGDMIEMLNMGIVSKEHMFQEAMDSNTMQTWAFRVLGWMLLWGSFSLMASPLTTFVSWIPVVSTLVELASCLMTFLLSICLALVTIALGWIRFRPTVGAALLTCALLPIFLGNTFGNKNKRN